MPDEQSRIKEFFEARTQKITKKIENTPMEKFFLFFLILITVAAAVLGFLQFKQNLEDPLRASYLEQERGKIQAKYNVNTAASGQELSQEDAALLQRKDSDLDGLSDYSEIYLYKTNAYMEDTDSDGLLDKDEILNGTDPLCPEGQDCVSAVEEELANQPQVTNSNLNQMVETNVDLTAMDFAEFQAKLLSGEITLADLGIDNPAMEETLAQLRAAQSQAALNQNLNNNVNIEKQSEAERQQVLEEMKNMSVEEIRAMLGAEMEKRGLDKSLLDQMDDATLKQYFEEALGSL